jgi:DNA polymerase II small subunit/DNA polymerase delta subunit B
VWILLISGLSLAGCDSLRLAPSEQQKQNAWLHNRTAAVAAETAKTEQSSQQLQALTQLSELQSRAFTSYCGLPKEYPQAETAEQILSESNQQLASAATTESAERPDPWQVADSVLEFGIGLAALFGGVCGTRAVQFLKDARTKSQALKEIIEGNELFKQQQPSQADAFKAAQQNQSPETRQLVAAIKG